MSSGLSNPTIHDKRDRPFWIVNGVLSVAALALLAYLLLLRQGDHGDRSALSFMPAVNASLNATSATLLVLAVRAIRAKRVVQHQRLMMAAFAASTLFLVGYLAYHYVHGDTRYAGDGALRTVYLALLASHVVLSIPVVPMCLAAFYFAFRKRFETHKAITRVLFPTWLYVSVTGVIVYVMLRSSYG